MGEYDNLVIRSCPIRPCTGTACRHHDKCEAKKDRK